MTKLTGGEASQNSGRVPGNGGDVVAKAACVALSLEAPAEEPHTQFGMPYFVTLPRAVGYFTFIRRNKMFFRRITTSQYAKALP